MNKHLFVTISMSAAVAMGGCVQPEAGPVGVANPASQYCIQLGGTLTIKDGKDGQYGVCTLPDGSEIEEWELFRRDHAK